MHIFILHSFIYHLSKVVASGELRNADSDIKYANFRGQQAVHAMALSQRLHLYYLSLMPLCYWSLRVHHNMLDEQKFDMYVGYSDTEVVDHIS